MSVTEASHTQIPSRGMRAWKKKTSLWQWRTARCGGRLWIRSRLPGPPDDDDDVSVLIRKQTIELLQAARLAVQSVFRFVCVRTALTRRCYFQLEFCNNFVNVFQNVILPTLF